MNKRLSHVMKHLNKDHDTSSIRSSCVSNYYHSGPSDDDVVVVNCIRTAMCKAKRGNFRNTSAVELLTPVLKYVVKDLSDPSLVDDICVGTVLEIGGLRATECRMASFLAGLPKTVTVRTVNRQCSSGLQAIADIAASIKAGYIDIGIAAGLESMSNNSMRVKGKLQVSDEIKMNNDALNCLLPMGITSENVAQEFDVSREEQDRFSYNSHQRAFKASETVFKDEILPIKTSVKDKKTGNVKQIVVDKDDGIRPNTTIEGLSKLKPVFKKGGSTTAGNASQLTDGASALLLMKRSKATQLGLRVMARFTAFAVSGVRPEIMGVGPAYAIPKVCKQVGLNHLSDIDLFEINEAFASQALYCCKKLGLGLDVVNVNGGAIAIGHPLGMSGNRMAITLIKEMERRGLKRGIVSMCIGSGMGAAGIFERI